MIKYIKCNGGITSNGDQNYINASYRLPVSGLNTFVEASFIYSNQQLGSNLAALNAKGDSNIATLRVSHY
jgi:hemolysin activation/secretion protein